MPPHDIFIDFCRNTNTTQNLPATGKTVSSFSSFIQTTGLVESVALTPRESKVPNFTGTAALILAAFCVKGALSASNKKAVAISQP